MSNLSVVEVADSFFTFHLSSPDDVPAEESDSGSDQS